MPTSFANSTYESQLRSMLADTGSVHSSMAWNLLQDWRIASERMVDFDNAVTDDAAHLPVVTAGAPPSPFSSPKGFERVFGDCYVKHVRSVSGTTAPGSAAKLSSFLCAAKNAGNHYGGTGGPGALANDLKLAAVIDLGNLGLFFRDGATGASDLPVVPEFSGFEAPAGPAGSPVDLPAWLDEKLMAHSLTAPAQHPFLKALVRHMSATRVSLPYEPSWVTTWSAFESLAGGDPRRWQPLVGVPPRNTPRWLLLLVYPVWMTDLLVRPSQMDAGWFAEHFPPPPVAGRGLAMELHPSEIHRRLPEYIHARVDFRPWLDNPKFSPIHACAPLDGQPAHDLPGAQSAHLSELISRYGLEPAWIKYTHPATVPAA